MNTTTQQGISPLRQRMIEEMCMRQLAPKTREANIRAVLHFTRYLCRSPDTATAEELRAYQLHCVKQGISAITLNATITGLKFFSEATMRAPKWLRSAAIVHRVMAAIGKVNDRAWRCA
jgi:integrase/recombinase XerD